MTSPCLSSELSLDAGNRIIIDLCGPPADKDWPFDCNSRLNNGLHRNANGCLWVAPQMSGLAFAGAGASSCSFFCGYNTSASAYNTAVASLTLTNVDNCRYRDYIVHTDYNYKVTPTSGTSTVTNFHRYVQGVDGADAGWQLVHTVDAGTNDVQRISTSDVWAIKGLAPGASRTIKVGMRVNAALGSGNANTFDARIGVFSIADG